MTYAERRRKREAERVLARDAIRLNPFLWAPAPVAAKPGPSAEYRVRRFLARPFRSAFRGIVSGERERRVLLKVAASNARAKDAGR